MPATMLSKSALFLTRIVLIYVSTCLAGPVPDASANLFQRPPGATADFRVCSPPFDNPKQERACSALGTLTCDGQMTGNAFLVQTEGLRDIVVSAAHAFIDRKTGNPHRQCAFFLTGSSQGLEIEKAILLNGAPYRTIRYSDIAAAQIGRIVDHVAGRIPLEATSPEKLSALLDDPSIQFAFIGIHPWEKIAVVSGYECNPVLPKSDNRLVNSRFEVIHNCPLTKGFSGSPGMKWDPHRSEYNAFCVQNAGTVSKKRQPFDPALNANICAIITPQFIELANGLARNELLQAPPGGAMVDYAGQESD